MIKRITDKTCLSGVSSPLLPLIYADLMCACNDSDGVFVQLDESDTAVTVFSMKNGSAVAVKKGSVSDFEELEAFFAFSGVSSFVSDFSSDSLKAKPYKLMVCNTGRKSTEPISHITDRSSVSEYKTVYSLLCNKDENFENWFPAFSKKINNGVSAAVYKIVDGLAVSTAVCTAKYHETAIISGVYTDERFRKKGYASECVNELLNCLYNAGTQKVYLWCEDKNISFYNKLGFTLCGQVYVREEF